MGEKMQFNTLMGRPLALRPSSSQNTNAVTFGRNVNKAQAVAQEELVTVARAERKAEAVKYAHAPIPAFDYIQGRLNATLAQDFSNKVFSIKGEAQFTGKDLLDSLMSLKAAQPNNAPNVDRLTGFELAQLGKTETSLRDFADSKKIPFGLMYDALREAHRYGLVYQMKDLKRGATYYGVPQSVRDMLKLAVPQEAPPVSAVQAETVAKKPLSPFGKTLQSLLEKAKTLSPKDEFFEFSAQLANSALETGVINEEAIPAEFKPVIARIGVTETMPGSILTVFESSVGGPFESIAKDLCLNGITEGLLDQQEFQEVKDSLRVPA